MRRPREYVFEWEMDNEANTPITVYAWVGDGDPSVGLGREAEVNVEWIDEAGNTVDITDKICTDDFLDELRDHALEIDEEEVSRLYEMRGESEDDHTDREGM